LQLYKVSEDNGASEPWNLENLWQFDVQLLLNQWLLGVARWKGYGGVVWTLHLGPVVFNYYRNHN